MKSSLVVRKMAVMAMEFQDRSANHAIRNFKSLLHVRPVASMRPFSTSFLMWRRGDV